VGREPCRLASSADSTASPRLQCAVYEDGLLFAIRDIQPRAPTHVLVIPKQHIVSARELTEEDTPLLGHIFAKANGIARELGIDESGFRLTFNVGPDGGQSVYHLHLHLLGGGKLGTEA
jgi:histidine triad (HIT) family protein